MIGQCAVLMAQRCRRCHHFFDWRRPIRPIRMQVQIAAEGGPHLAAAKIGRCRTQFSQHVRLAPGPGLLDHSGSLWADARQRLPTVVAAMAFPRSRVKTLNNVGRTPIGHDPPRILAASILVVGDTTQCSYRIHGLGVPGKITTADQPRIQGKLLRIRQFHQR